MQEYRIHRLEKAKEQYGKPPARNTMHQEIVGAKAWPVPKPTDLIFPKTHREGRPRTAYSLCHTYVCLRLMEGADIYQIARNCRTSVEMIEKCYAAHIKTSRRHQREAIKKEEGRFRS